MRLVSNSLCTRSERASTPNMPSADFSHVVGADYSDPQSISLARDGPGQHRRSPGVNTCLSAHERRVYVPGLWQLGDFVLCRGFVPPDPPNSISVRRPMRSRYPTLAGRLPPGTSRANGKSPCTTTTPFATAWLGLGLANLSIFVVSSAHP